MAFDWFNRLRQPRTEYWIGCIDFGTAYSKAAMVLAEDLSDLKASDVKPLAIGAGQSNQDFLLPSILFLTDEAIFFGGAADRLAQQNEHIGRLPFLSPKQYLSTHAPQQLSEGLEAEIDPTGSYSARQLIALYLAYLLRRSELAAQEIDLEWPPKLRIARPAWGPERAQWGEEILRDLVRRALMLVDALGDALTSQNGLEHGEALRAWNGMPDPGTDRDSKLFQLADDGTATVMEATAVATGSIRPRGRRIVVVADIGGGTSDFGAFMTGLPGHNVVAEIEGGSRVLRQAGDVLDMHVRRMLLQSAGLLADDPAARGPSTLLRRRQRTLKEALFQQGDIVVEAGDFFLELSLDEFLADELVTGFSQRLAQTFTSTLEAAREVASSFSKGRLIPIEIMATGGGAKLPMVQSMITDPDISWPTKVIEPELFGDAAPDFKAVYPQLVVAVGGAMKSLAKQTAPLHS